MAGEIHRLWPDASAAPMTDAELLKAYGRPQGDGWLRANFVSSVDGAVEIDGVSAGLGSRADKRVFDLLRLQADALLVGAGTLRTEGYGAVRLSDEHARWRTGNGLSAHPTLVIVSGRLALDADSPMFVDAPARPIVITSESAPGDLRERLSPVAEIVPCGATSVDLGVALGKLRERGFSQVLSEGGPHLLGALTAADVLDELCLTISPQLAGPSAGRITAGPVSAQRKLDLAHVLKAESDLILRYTKRNN